MLRERRTRRSTHKLVAVATVFCAALATCWLAAPAGAVNISFPITTMFGYTGAQQTFTVPAGVTHVHVLAVGGRGGNGLAPGGGLGGAPAEVSGDLEVLPGETLFVEVGGVGTEASSETIARAFNGGNYAGQGQAAGGGASDVRLLSRPDNDTANSLFSRLIVAGGGGGGGAGSEGTLGGAGGNAGSEGASAGGGVGGGPGTESAGGIGACINRDCDGTLGMGAEGTIGGPGSGGGGGGGGLFGGAGGTSNAKNTGAGGGGGSSLQPAGGKTVVPAVLTAPQVQISYTPAAVPAPHTEPAPMILPSSNFSLLRPIVAFNRSINLVLGLPGPGAVTASAEATSVVTVKKHGKRVHKRVRFVFGSAHANATAAGALELAIKPTARGRKTLAQHRPVPVTLAVTFTATGGGHTTRHASVTLPRR